MNIEGTSHVALASNRRLLALLMIYSSSHNCFGLVLLPDFVGDGMHYYVIGNNALNIGMEQMKEVE